MFLTARLVCLVGLVVIYSFCMRGTQYLSCSLVVSVVDVLCIMSVLALTHCQNPIRAEWW